MLIKQQNGISLIELLIGLLVGTIVAAGAISIFSGSVKSSTDNINLTRLNQDLRAMMDIMARDIRRAGYITSNPATNLNSVLDNPFLDDQTIGATSDITKLGYDGGTDNCILYAYNRDESDDNDNNENSGAGDGRIDVETREKLGFRLDSGGELDMRQTGTTNENCIDGSWQSITEPEVEITTLSFVLVDKALNVTSMDMMTDANTNGTTNGIPDGFADVDVNTNGTTNGIPDGYADVDINKNGSCDSTEACNTCSNTGVSGDPACLYIRTVTITLAGRLRSDNTVTQSITEQVRVRNDKYVAAVP